MSKLGQVEVLTDQGQAGVEGGAGNRGDQADVLSLVSGVRWPEAGPGHASEGAEAGE